MGSTYAGYQVFRFDLAHVVFGDDFELPFRTFGQRGSGLSCEVSSERTAPGQKVLERVAGRLASL